MVIHDSWGWNGRKMKLDTYLVYTMLFGCAEFASELAVALAKAINTHTREFPIPATTAC